ncbi:MAG: NAD(P)H-dependent oxidoreductase subunit E [Chloroflexi bacterium]|nr:NAD(P)H-dependent oxidoreductase subunit E [Chloroflexota bacterium]
MECKMSLDRVGEIIERYRDEKGATVAILQDIQEEYNYLPKEALAQVAGELGIPLSQILRVATFYKAFSLKPRGKYLINVCLGTACHVRGGERNLEKLQRDLGIQAGETTGDRLFTLEKVYCLGGCALGPLVVIGGKYYSKMNPLKLEAMLKEHARGHV